MNKHRFVILAGGGGLAALLLITGLAGAGPLAGPVHQTGAPPVVSCQGQVTVDGSPYHGTGYFKFAVVNPAGDTTHWSNDGTSSGAAEPGTAVALTVTDGLFNLLLGDTSLPNMSQTLSAAVCDGTDRALRVWFSSDGSHFSRLSPDRRIATAPFALQAEEAKHAAAAGDADTLDRQDASAFWSLGGNSGTVSTTHFLRTTDGQPLVMRTNDTERARLDAAGNLGLGTNSPSERLTVRGDALVLDDDAPVARGYTSANLDGPNSVFVAGRYAHVTSFNNNTLAVFDVANPDNPVAKGFFSTNLDGPQSVYVAGGYAYVASWYNNRLAVFDILDPLHIAARGHTETNLNCPASVYVARRHAYVASHDNHTLAVFDVADPDRLAAKGHTGTNLDQPYSVIVAGRHAYVASPGNDRLAVLDATNPDNPVAQGYGTTNPYGVTSVVMAGRPAHAVSFASNRQALYDLNHLETRTLEEGSLQTSALGVVGSAVVGNDLVVQGRLTVGPGGAQVGGDLGVEGYLFAHVNVTTVTGGSALAVTQSGVILVNSAGVAIITLPAAASAEGVAFTIKRINTGAVTVNPAGGNIDGAASHSLAAQHGMSPWSVMARTGFSSAGKETLA